MAYLSRQIGLQRFTVFAFFCLVFVGFLTWFSYHSMQRLQALELLKHDVSSIESMMLTLRRNEKNFMMRRHLDDVGKFDANFFLLKQKLKNLSVQFNHKLISNQLVSIEVKLVKYHQKFHELVVVKEDIGLTHALGKEGLLRASIHSVEEVIDKERHAELYTQMLMLRRDEKDFILRLDDIYVRQHDEKFTQLLSDIASFPQTIQSQILPPLMIYKAKFGDLVESYQTLGLTEDLGLRGMMRAHMYQADKQKVKLIKLVDRRILSAYENFNHQLLWVVVIGITLLSILFIGLCREKPANSAKSK